MDKVECRAERKASRSQGGSLTGTGWNTIQGELGQRVSKHKSISMAG